METNSIKKQGDAPVLAVVIVAHPDDETLWAGGTILMHRGWHWFIAALCRGDDSDRASRFFNAVTRLRASGAIGHLHDGPEQVSLCESDVQEAVLSLLPVRSYDIVITHSPFGEYSRHLRHEETGMAVLSLWENGTIHTKQLWMFAYEDGGKKHLPRPIENAHCRKKLPNDTLEEKRAIIEEIYGFGPYSFEGRTAPMEEAFWCFTSPKEAGEWVEKEGSKE